MFSLDNKLWNKSKYFRSNVSLLRKQLKLKMRHNLVLRSPTLWHVTQTQVYTGSLHSSRRSPLIPPYVQLRQSPFLSLEACDHVNHSYPPPATHKRPSLCPRLCQNPFPLIKHILIELTVLYVNSTIKQVLTILRKTSI